MAAALDRLDGRLMLVSAIVFAIAFATILTAHAYEMFGGYSPCELCLLERYAYYFGVPASFIAFFVARANKIGAARALLGLIALAFLLNAGLAFYHAGVEWKWWPGPSTCSGGSALEWDQNGLASQLAHTKVVRCDEAAWRFFALSFAGWDAVVSLVLAAIAAYGAAMRR